MAETAGRKTVSEVLAAAAAGGHLRVSESERERAIGSLQAAFVAGRVDKDEFESRVGQALAAETNAELAAPVADLPDSRPVARAARPALRPLRIAAREQQAAVREQQAAVREQRAAAREQQAAVRWWAAGLIIPLATATAQTIDAVPGDGGYALIVVLAVLAFVVCWLVAGADLLVQWWGGAGPSARACARCAHAAGAHRAQARCADWAGAGNVPARCACPGYLGHVNAPPSRRLPP